MAIVVLTTLVLVAPLTACSTVDPSPSPTPQVERTVLPSTPGAPAGTPRATSNPTFYRDPESAPWGVVTVPDRSLVGNHTNSVCRVQVPRDGGSIEYARGTAIKERSEIVGYRVA